MARGNPLDDGVISSVYEMLRGSCAAGAPITLHEPTKPMLTEAAAAGFSCLTIQAAELETNSDALPLSADS
jgi:hypothetical protein